MNLTIVIKKVKLLKGFRSYIVYFGESGSSPILVVVYSIRLITFKLSSSFNRYL